MAKPLLPVALWERIKPMLPAPKPRRFRYPGRKPVDDRKTLTAILFDLKTGVAWELLPQEMGCGSDKTCWWRLRDWHEAGNRQELREVLLAELNGADGLEWSLVSVDSRSFRALGGREKTGPSRVDRRNTQHEIIDFKGTPLAATVTATNVPDVKEPEPLVDPIPPVGGKPGRPRRRPEDVYVDRGYDSESHRQRLRRRGIEPRIARRNTPRGSGLGKIGWVVERNLSRLPR